MEEFKAYLSIQEKNNMILKMGQLELLSLRKIKNEEIMEIWKSGNWK